MTDQQPTIRKLTNLADLPGRDIDVRIEIEGSEPMVIPCRSLTFKRYQEIGRMVQDPAPPVSGAGPRGPIYNYTDPAYLAAKDEVGEQRRYLRLAEFVVATVPGETLEQRAAWLADNVEMGVLLALSRQMDMTLRGGATDVESRAATFHDV